MTVPASEPTPEELARRYGVTVGDVMDLCLLVAPSPIPTDPHFGPDTPPVTPDMVAHWIDRVADSVRSRVLALAQYQNDTGRWAAIVGSARTAVLNGAAAYVVSAHFPMKAGLNDATSYSAELWRRHTEEMAYLSETLPKVFVDQDATGVVDPETGTVGVSPRTSKGPSNIPASLFEVYPARNPYQYPPAPGTEWPWR